MTNGDGNEISLSEGKLQLNLENYDPQNDKQVIDSPKSLRVCRENGIVVSALFEKNRNKFLVEAKGDAFAAGVQFEHWEKRRCEMIKFLRKERNRLLQEEETTAISPVESVRIQSKEKLEQLNMRFVKKQENMITKQKYFELVDQRTQEEANQARKRLADRNAIYAKQQDDQRNDILLKVQRFQDKQKELRIERREEKKRLRDERDHIIQQLKLAESSRMVKKANNLKASDGKLAQQQLKVKQKVEKIASITEAIASNKVKMAEEKQQRAKQSRVSLDVKKEENRMTRNEETERKRLRIQQLYSDRQTQHEEIVKRFSEKDERYHQLKKQRQSERLNHVAYRLILQQQRNQRQAANSKYEEDRNNLNRHQAMKKYQHQEEVLQNLSAEKERQINSKKQWNLLRHRDRFEASERLRLMDEYNESQQRELIDLKNAKSSEIADQAARYRETGIRNRDILLNIKIAHRSDEVPGPGSYLGVGDCDLVNHSSPSAFFGGAPIRCSVETDVPGPAEYEPCHNFVLPYHGSVRYPRKIKLTAL